LYTVISLWEGMLRITYNVLLSLIQLSQTQLFSMTVVYNVKLFIQFVSSY